MLDLDSAAMAVIRCPVTQTPVHRGSPALLAALNEAIAEKTLTNRIGIAVGDPMDDVLVNESGQIALAVRAGIIQLIAGEAVEIPESIR